MLQINVSKNCLDNDNAELSYYPYASFTDQQLPMLKVAALWFDKLVILDPVGASWLFDWQKGKKSAQEDRLHYLLKFLKSRADGRPHDWRNQLWLQNLTRTIH